MKRLTWALWPVAAAPLQASRADRWPLVARDLRRRVRAALAPWSPDTVAAGHRWATAVREAGLVAGTLVPLSGPLREALEHTVQWGPCLLVLDCSSGTPQQLLAAVGALRACRSPTLRWATLGLPRCWPDVAGPDLALQEPATTAAACAHCAARGDCPGPVAGVAAVPQAAPQSNQFDLRRSHGEGLLRADVGHGTEHWALAGQADGAEVARAMARGQLYLDLSEAARLGDFAEELRLLAADDVGIWRPQPGQPFAQEEQGLIALLDALRGVVVDVGAGPVRYTAVLRQRIRAGEVRYVAVEPDLAHLNNSAAALPEGTFVRGVGEALPLADRCADAVLWLRSWNHLRDPAQAVREALRVAKPGAQLIAVDNVAFGLLRSAEQLTRAHAVTVEETPFEHWRNDGATEALQVICAQGGRRVAAERIAEVGIGTSNQWLLVVRVLE